MNFFIKIPYYLLHRNPFFGLIFKLFFKRFKYKLNNEKLLFDIPYNYITNSWLPGFLFKTYELNDVYLIKKHLKNNEKVLNIGGGLGFIATLIFKITNQKVTVVEVNKEIIEVLEKNLNHNSVEYLLIDKPLSFSENLSFKLSNDKSFISKSTTIAKDISSNVLDCKVINQDYFNNFDVLVIDAEGYEEYLFTELKGMNFKKIIVEFHPKDYLENDINSLIKILSEFDYVEVDSYFQSKVFIKKNLKL